MEIRVSKFPQKNLYVLIQVVFFQHLPGNFTYYLLKIQTS